MSKNNRVEIVFLGGDTLTVNGTILEGEAGDLALIIEQLIYQMGQTNE